MALASSLRLVLTGGGTFGSVTPLLALAEELTRTDTVLGWIGTAGGQERHLVEREGFRFFAIASGKFRRYFSLRTIIDPFFIVAGFMQSVVILRRLRPTHVVAAGSYVSVPVVFAARLLRIPAFTLQQDVQPGLANRFMRYSVRRVFCVFSESCRTFGSKGHVTGNAVRRVFRSPALADMKTLPILRDKSVPLLVVIGGGTGALSLNRILVTIVPDLVSSYQVVHVTGRHKSIPLTLPRYFAFEFLSKEDLASLMREAQCVVSRAGMGALSELAALARPAIIVPLPASHQEKNADYLGKRDAVCVVTEDAGAAALLRNIRSMLSDPSLQKYVAARLNEALPTDGARAMIRILRATPTLRPSKNYP